VENLLMRISCGVILLVFVVWIDVVAFLG